MNALLKAAASGIIGTGLLFGCATASEHHAITTEQLEPYECGTITRLHTYQGVFLASQPSPEDFEQARKGGIKTVVNMRHENEIKDFDERAVVTGLGIEYENPAWDGPEELTDAAIEKNLDILRNAQRPMLIHCGSANRVGAIWMAYRVIDGGLSRTDALAEAKVVGLRSPDYERIINNYLDRHGQ